jgi:hypothetical protein
VNRGLNAAAQALGFAGTQNAIEGTLDGHRIRIELASIAGISIPGTPSYKVPVTLLKFLWSTPLDLGLDVAFASSEHAPTTRSFACPIVIRDSKFLLGYRALSEEPLRAKLFLTREVRAAILSYPRTLVNDWGVTHQFVTRLVDARDIQSKLRALIEVGRPLEEAQRRMPIPFELHPLLGLFEECAERFKLTFSRCGLMLYGEIFDCRTFLFRRWRHGQPEVLLNVRIPTPSDTGLELTAGTWRDKLNFVTGDIRSGDREFDKMFRVRGRDKGRIAAALDASLRAQLKDLRERRGLTIARGVVSIRYESPDELLSLPQDLPQVAHCAKSFAEKLSHVAVKNAKRTAYR